MRAAPRRQVTVLVVGEDEERRVILADVLRRDGYVVILARGAGEAAGILELPVARIDLVLSDLRREAPTASALARLVRATEERTPLMIVDETTDLAGDATTLPKPFRLDVLRRAVLTTIVADVKRKTA